MANGLFGGGTGILNDPYLIEDAFDLDAVKNDLTAHYKLIADIDLNISPFNEGEGWTPIGDNSENHNSTRFTGVFDGDGFVVRNLFINRPSTEYQGLFGYTIGSSIKNIGVEDVNITGGSYTGGLVGYNRSSSIIENSYSTGSVTGGSNTGGLVGRNDNSSIINSYSTGSVTGSFSTGGLVGYNSNSSIINSYSTGSVTGGSSYTGGLVGRNDSSSVIKNSYSTRSVTGSSYTGGLVGYNSKSSIINSYSTGSVTGGSNTRGLVGYSYVSSVTNSYWDIETSGRTSSEGGVGKTTAEMQTPSTFVGWENETLEDGTPVWILQDGEYPKLWFEVAVQKILIKKSDGVYVYLGQNKEWQSAGVSPTAQDFLEKGIDYLFVLDRQVTVLSPIGMDDNGINGQLLENGRVFKEKIDLTKYIDIRSIKVESK